MPGTGSGCARCRWLPINGFDSSRVFLHPCQVLNIPEHRKAIDKLDEELVRLLSERTRHVLAIGEIKRKGGQEIYAPHRERA
ncbi:MAG TPA: chorismate mutase, partial [Verrucomicrobiae bacterium]|nr:chorismate mutase [Verrucomicrobiae bacterium]